MALNTAIKLYDKHLDTLIASESPSSSMIIDVLIARDYVHECLQQEASSINIDVLRNIKGLDLDLKEQLELKEQLISQNYLELEQFKQLKSPLAGAWWWKFSKPVHILDRFDWLFNLGTLFCLGFSFSITIELISRLLAGEGDLLLSIIAAIQASITLWIGKTFFTKSPGETIDKIFKKIFHFSKISEHLHAELSFIAALAIAILTFVFRLIFIPHFSDYQKRVGIANFNQNNISQAFYNLQKAININPQNIKAKHHLGEVYDRISIPQDAKKLYELGVAQGYIASYNNLGRLLIKEGEYEQAFQVLKQGLYLAEKVIQKNLDYKQGDYPKDKYSLLKNLGWVRFKQKNNKQAKSYLNAAILQNQNLSEKRAAAHCLLAKILTTDLLNNTNGEQIINASETNNLMNQIDNNIKQWNLCEDKILKQKILTSEEEDWYTQHPEQIQSLTDLRNQIFTKNLEQSQ